MQSRNRMMRTLAEMIGFQVVWLASALGAAAGAALPGITAAAAFLALQIATARPVRPMLAVVGAAAALGLAVESLLAAAGLVSYAAPWPLQGVAPAWIVGLWAAFGSTTPAMARLFGNVGWPALAAVGAALAPLSYLAGAGLGALSLPRGAAAAAIAVGVAWAIALPLLVRLDSACREAAVNPAAPDR